MPHSAASSKMGSGAQSTPAQPEMRPEVEDVLVVERSSRDVHMSDSDGQRVVKFDKFDSVTLSDTYEDLRTETPRYASMVSRMESSARVRTDGDGGGGMISRKKTSTTIVAMRTSGKKQIIRRMSTDVAHRLIAQAPDQYCTVTPVASNNFMANPSNRQSPAQTPNHEITRTQRISGSSEGSDDDTDDNDWNFEADEDMVRRDGPGNVVSAQAVTGSSMLNNTVVIDSKKHAQHGVLDLESHRLGNHERDLVRRFVSAGNWQGNKFAVGMTVGVTCASTPAESTSPGTPKGKDGFVRTGVIIAAYVKSYDIRFDDDDSLRSRASTGGTVASSNGSMFSTSSTGSSSSETKHSESKYGESKTPDSPPLLSSVRSLSLSSAASGVLGECDVDESRLHEPDHAKEANERLRVEALDTAARVSHATQYPLCNSNDIDKYTSTHWVQANDGRYHPPDESQSH